MELRNVTDKHCPECKAETVSVSLDTGHRGKILVHCNGSRWERRTFECGLSVVFVPNFGTTKMEGTCKNSFEYKDRQRKRVALLDVLMPIVHDADVDEVFKDEVARFLKSCQDRMRWGEGDF